MYSRDYVKKKLIPGAWRRRAYFYSANIFGVLSFLFISLIAAPLIHEAAHTTLLDYMGCPYHTEFSVTGDYNMRGQINLFCDLSLRGTVFVLGAGVFSTLVFSALLFMLSSHLHLRGMLNHANYVMYLALGFLMDPIFYSFAMEGDIVNILSVLEREDWMPYVPILGTLLFAFAVAYYYVYTESFMEDYLRMKKEVDAAEGFIKEIRG